MVVQQPKWWQKIYLDSSYAAEFFYNGRGGKMLAENGYIYEKQHKRKLGGSQLPIYKWENFIRFITCYSTTDVAMRLLIKVGT